MEDKTQCNVWQPVIDACQKIDTIHLKWQAQLSEWDETRPLWRRTIEDDPRDEVLLDWEAQFVEAAEKFKDAVRAAAGSFVSLPATKRMCDSLTRPTPCTGMTLNQLREVGRNMWSESGDWLDKAHAAIGSQPATTDAPLTVSFREAIDGLEELDLPRTPKTTLRRYHQDPKTARLLGVDPKGRASLQRYRVDTLKVLASKAQSKKTTPPQLRAREKGDGRLRVNSGQNGTTQSE